MYDLYRSNDKYYHYILILKRDFPLTIKVAEELGKYLARKLEKETKQYGTKVEYLAIEKSNDAGQPHLHLLFKTTQDRYSLIEKLEYIKKYTPIALQHQGAIPNAIPIFTKYRGEMKCEYFRDKEKCPGKGKCSLINKDGDLKCNSNNNLKDCTPQEYLNNVRKYLIGKKDDDNCMYFYMKQSM